MVLGAAAAPADPLGPRVTPASRVPTEARENKAYGAQKAQGASKGLRDLVAWTARKAYRDHRESADNR